MKRIRLVVAYDGTQYHGWQIQPGAVTIESVLNEALTQLMREPIQVIGASRTDSGVHARGNVAVFDTESQMPPDKICMALNQRLPEDIRVQVSEEVPSDWHPRKDVYKRQTYEDGTAAADRWERIMGKWYYFNPEGYAVTGWNQIQDTWYYICLLYTSRCV